MLCLGLVFSNEFKVEISNERNLKEQKSSMLSKFINNFARNNRKRYRSEADEILKTFLTITPEGSSSEKNSLDCVILSIHISQIRRGKLDIFLDRMKNVSTQLNLIPPFYIVSSTHIPFPIQSKILKHLANRGLLHQFKFVNFVSFNIKKDEDGYSRGKPSAKSGPNVVFFKTMEYFARLNYSTVLLLEPDVKFVKDNWYDSLYGLSLIESFWVMGSIYKGDHDVDSEVWSHHINGVALYNIGNKAFRDYLVVLKSYLLMSSSISGNEVNYDAAWSYFKTFIRSKTKLGTPNLQKRYITKLRRIDNLFLNTNCIVNISPELDKNMNLSSVLNLFPSAVLIHQKG